MPRVRMGPKGPKRSLAGKSGTNKKTPHKSAGVSSLLKSNMNKGTGGMYGSGGANGSRY